MEASSTAGNKLRWRRGLHRLGVILAAAAALSAPTTAIAQPPPTDAALAEALFQDAKALMTAGRYAEACPKLAESQRLDPGTGTLLALALCHENEGKSASAWAEFTQVAAAAQKDNRTDRVRVAREHVRHLEPNLSRLTISVPPSVAGLKGFEVTRDGIFIGPAVWGTAMPIDPGGHAVEAWASGKTRWTTTAQIGPKGDRQTVSVPPLNDAPSAPEAMPAASASSAEGSPPAGGSSRRPVAFVLGGVGLAALGVGAYFGVRAISESRDAKARCSPTLCTDPQAVRLNDDAKVAATVADIGFGLGIASIGVGAILLLTAPAAPDPKKASARAIPWVGPGLFGVTVQSVW